MKRKHIDRLSGLPENILHHILSFLPTKEAVQTCLLSKRWVDLWCSVPSLDFDQDLFLPSRNTPEPPIDFVEFVDSVLFRRDGSSLYKFRLCLWTAIFDDIVDMSRVNSWIIFALKHQVQILDLDLQESSELTSRLFNSHSLEVLKLDLNSHVLNLPTSVYLSSLKILFLSNISVEDDKLSHALTCCPVLETLSIAECSFWIPRLTIATPKLKILIIRDHVSSIDVFAPCLTSLEISTVSGVPISFLDNLTSLIDAKISLPVCSSESFVHLINALCHAQSLQLCTLFLVTSAEKLVDESHIVRCIEGPFYNLKLLKLVTLFSNGEALVIKSLLNRSPNIESICMKYDEDFAPTSLGKAIGADKGWLGFELSHLKFTGMLDFQGSKNEVKFVKFFVENAKKLEKLIIVASGSKRRSSVNKMLEKIRKTLLTYPRVSKLSFGPSSDANGSISCTFAQQE